MPRVFRLILVCKLGTKMQHQKKLQDNYSIHLHLHFHSKVIGIIEDMDVRHGLSNPNAFADKNFPKNFQKYIPQNAGN